MNLPIKRGTARRLGIRYPYQAFRRRLFLHPDQSLEDAKRMQDALNEMDYHQHLATLGIFPVRHMAGYSTP